MATKKAKITFTCTPELRKDLEEWAGSENRTLSNLVETTLETAVNGHKESQSEPKPEPKPEPKKP